MALKINIRVIPTNILPVQLAKFYSSLKFAVLLKHTMSQIGKCESSSVGRARPCQGRGRGFESRLPLRCRRKAALFFKLCPGGGTGRHAGLKIL